MIVLGIDPGASGGLAIVSHAEGFPARAIATWKMPETTAELWEAIDASVGVYDVSFAVLEKVWAAPTKGRQQGASGMFRFGEGFGMLQMALAARCIPHQLVTPQKWQKALSCMSKGDKNVTKARAQQLFPDVKVTHAVADALLLAYYGRFVHQPEPSNETH